MLEQDMETLTQMFPDQIIEPGLKFIARQKIFLDGTRSDLIFHDSSGCTLVVELKQTDFHSEHLNQVDHYRELLGGSGVRAMLLAPKEPSPSLMQMAMSRSIEIKHVPIKTFKEIAKQHEIQITKAGETKILDPKVLAVEVQGTLFTKQGIVPVLQNLQKKQSPYWQTISVSVLEELCKTHPSFLAEYSWPGITHPKTAPVHWHYFYEPILGHATKAYDRPMTFNITYDQESNPNHSSTSLEHHRISKYNFRLFVEKVRGAAIMYELLWGENSEQNKEIYVSKLQQAAINLKNKFSNYSLYLYYFRRQCKSGQDKQFRLTLPEQNDRIPWLLETVGEHFATEKPWFFDLYLWPSNDAFNSANRVASEFNIFVSEMMPIYDIYRNIFTKLYKTNLETT